ncbi:hypothetical protein OIN60_10755 [Paenibacillus sp. P96]|uniref:Uncharacterized protein n=1 Tax=Paenibacillus zeirhizosphaerae TaxID=2987519 RepID=A0ABT9FRL0_9BACL|nr:hypothetical protein [Paenibacillus sp. P96]MDP4097250.1 hypothetical protein [Paenibacillus sp. P96]
MANQKNGRAKKKAAVRQSPPPLSQLTPQQIAVIAGLLSNALIVESILVDKDQQLEIVLSGSLRRHGKLDHLLSKLDATSLRDFFDAMNKS